MRAAFSIWFYVLLVHGKSFDMFARHERMSVAHAQIYTNARNKHALVASDSATVYLIISHDTMRADLARNTTISAKINIPARN
jgi:hypothetical protein